MSALVCVGAVVGIYFLLWLIAINLHDRGINVPAWLIRSFGIPFVYATEGGLHSTALFRSKSKAFVDLERVEYAYHAVVGFVAVWTFTFKDGDELFISPNRPGVNRLPKDLERILPGFSVKKWQTDFAQGDVEDTLVLWAAKPNPSIERTLPGKPVSASHVKRYAPR